MTKNKQVSAVATSASSEVLPYHRSVHVVAATERFGRSCGMPSEMLLRGTGLSASDLTDPEFLATTSQEIAMIRNLQAFDTRPGLGLLAGREYHVGTLGRLGSVLLYADTLAVAAGLLLEYRELLGSYFHFEVFEEQLTGNTVLTARELIDLGDVRAFVCEREFTALLRSARDLCQAPIVPLEVRVGYPEPAHGAMFSEALECPVSFGAPVHAIVLGLDALSTPLPLASPLARQAGEAECVRALERLRATGSVAQQVIQEVLYRQDGYPSLEVMAGRLHMSARTFRRRLHEEGTSYRAVVSRLQMEEATRLLRTSSSSIQEVARLVGFPDTPNFYRAFRRRFAIAPGEYRERAVSGIEDGALESAKRELSGEVR